MRTLPLLHRNTLLLAVGAVASVLVSSTVNAAPCSQVQAERRIYGAGGSAVTPTLKNVATALAGLPEAERITIFYSDPGACAGYGYWRDPQATNERTFKYWNAAGTESTCEAPETEITFAHMGNTPAFCPGDVPLPDDAARFVGPIQTINFITHYDSQQESISAEALYYIYGFGPGAAGKSVEPWTEPAAVFGRSTNSFVHQIVARSINVPGTAFKIPAGAGTTSDPGNFLVTNGDTVKAVNAWGTTSDVEQPLGYVSGSNATAGEQAQQVKTLAYQHYEQECAFLPDSARGKFDKANVRSGNYWLWTPAWFYARVGADGQPTDENVAKLIHWFDGTLLAPDALQAPPDLELPEGATFNQYGLGVQQIIVLSGDVPLCAQQAIRPDGDLNPVVSYAPETPCNGWYEYTATGSTEHEACTSGTDCRFGFREAY